MTQPVTLLKDPYIFADLQIRVQRGTVSITLVVQSLITQIPSASVRI